jgi:hypothetical protein
MSAHTLQGHTFSTDDSLYAGMGRSDGLAKLMPCKNKLGEATTEYVSECLATLPEGAPAACSPALFNLTSHNMHTCSKHQTFAPRAARWLARVPFDEDKGWSLR